MGKEKKPKTKRLLYLGKTLMVLWKVICKYNQRPVNIPTVCHSEFSSRRITVQISNTNPELRVQAQTGYLNRFHPPSSRHNAHQCVEMFQRNATEAHAKTHTCKDVSLNVPEKERLARECVVTTYEPFQGKIVLNSYLIPK